MPVAFSCSYCSIAFIVTYTENIQREVKKGDDEEGCDDEEEKD